jgi:hypothetical protein
MRISFFMTLGLLALAACPRPAAADWEYTKWGMTPEQVAKASRGNVQITNPRPAASDQKLEVRAMGTYAAGPLHFGASFGFDAGSRGLAFVTYSTYDASQNGLLKDWLLRKYGQPQSRQSADPDLETWTWNRPGMDQIELNIPDGDPAFVIHYPPEK